MVVVGVIGLLAAIALPQFAAYRKSAYDAAARADLRNAAVAQEAYFAEHGQYTADLDALKARGIKPSQGIALRAETSGSTFILTAKAAPCSPGTGEYYYSNQVGRIEGEACK